MIIGLKVDGQRALRPVARIIKITTSELRCYLDISRLLWMAVTMTMLFLSYWPLNKLL